MSESQPAARYRPDVFEVETIDQAKRIILTAEDTTTDERWRVETPYLADAIGEFLDPGKDSVVIDYGCGIGRLSKELIQRHECTVLGVDISLSMRQLAPAYVGDARFAVAPRTAFKALIDKGMRADAAIAIWSLQHCVKPADDIALIRYALKPGGLLFVCNTFHSAVPTDAGWADLGGDVRGLLCERFEELAHDPLSAEHTTDFIAGIGYLGKYRKPAA